MQFIILFLLFVYCYSSSINKIHIIEVPEEKPNRKDLAEDSILKEDAVYWMNQGTETLIKNLQEEEQIKKRVARNVIIFIGDGMGISTITASRIYKGQKYFGKSGEDHKLVFEDFPNVALVKTYNVDKQVPDSAGTATAIFTGVKTRFEAIGVDVTSSTSEFNETTFEASKLESLMDWAQAVGKHTGIVTTSSLTDATPACTYAKMYHRDIECDAEVLEKDKPYLKDIARQLIEDAPGINYKVILGGGQTYFGYDLTEDEDYCTRKDGLNLTEVWMDLHNDSSAVFAVNSGDLDQVDDATEYLLGIFSHKNLPYELVRDKSSNGSPSLTDMTQKALQILKKSTTGFVLMVEGAKIDKAHHDSYAKLSLEEAVEFDNAISFTINETDDDTLILVTADHSHSFTISGYGKRGADILGAATEDDKFYATLSYATGPGFLYHYQLNGTNSTNSPWREVFNDTNRETDAYYQQPTTSYLESATHGGEDVAIFAKGPNTHLIRGVIEQNYIAHFVSYSACIGPQASLNSHCNSAATSTISYLALLFIGCLNFVVQR